MIKALVTACGGDIGQGVIKSLRMSGEKIRVIGTEITADNCGLFMADKGYILEPVLKNEKRYLKQLVAICNEERVDIVFVCFEAEQSAIASAINILNKKHHHQGDNNLGLDDIEKTNTTNVIIKNRGLLCSSVQKDFRYLSGRQIAHIRISV